MKPTPWTPWQEGNCKVLHYHSCKVVGGTKILDQSSANHTSRNASIRNHVSPQNGYWIWPFSRYTLPLAAARMPYQWVHMLPACLTAFPINQQYQLRLKLPQIAKP